MGRLRDDFFDNIFNIGSQCIAVGVFALALGLFLGLLYLLLLFIVLSFLQTHKILTIDLVKLLLNVVDNLGDTRNKNELERVHTSVRHLQCLIQRHELGLQSRDCDQDLEELGELFASILD